MPCCLALIIMSLLSPFLWYRGLAKRRDNSSCLSKSGDNRNQATASSATDSRVFSVDELAAACNNYNDRYLLGRGRFGLVYKGSLKHPDQFVAIKKLHFNADGRRGVQAFLAEARMLAELHHPNLVRNIGFCINAAERLLVLEYMALGSLDDHLFGCNPEMPPLDWNTRMKIALCVARGLEYLHCKRDATLIYRDMKCSNILLSEGYDAKLSVFALAEEGPVDAEPRGRITVVGSSGYVAPEYARTRRLTVKFDIYGFGAVLFEIITGRRYSDFVKGEDRDFDAWTLLNMADPLLEGNFPRDEYSKAAALTEKCLHADPDRRPPIAEIVPELSNLSKASPCNVM